MAKGMTPSADKPPRSGEAWERGKSEADRVKLWDQTLKDGRDMSARGQAVIDSYRTK